MDTNILAHSRRVNAQRATSQAGNSKRHLKTVKVPSATDTKKMTQSGLYYNPSYVAANKRSTQYLFSHTNFI
jgi:hypothetical protein